MGREMAEASPVSASPVPVSPPSLSLLVRRQRGRGGHTWSLEIFTQRLSHHPRPLCGRGGEVRVKRLPWEPETKGDWRLVQWGHQNGGELTYCVQHMNAYHERIPTGPTTNHGKCHTLIHWYISYPYIWHTWGVGP